METEVNVFTFYTSTSFLPLYDLVSVYIRLIVLDTADRASISKDHVNHTLREILGMSKFSARCMLRLFIQDSRQNREINAE